MIRINIDELDRLAEVFIRLKSDVDDTMGKTSMLRNEMLDDAEFMAHPKSSDIIEIMDWAIDSLTSLNEDVGAVEVLFEKAKEDFTDNERALINEISAINNKLDSIRCQLDTTIASNQVVVVDNSEEVQVVNEVEQLVAGSATELELVNISALSNMARQEAEAGQVEDK